MKSKMNGLKLVLVAMFFATSCVLDDVSNLNPEIQERQESQVEEGYVMLDVNVGSNEAQSLLTKASDVNVVNINEIDIQKIRLYVFNGTTFEKQQLFEMSKSQITKNGEQYSVKINVKEGTNKKIYAIINETTGTTAPTASVTTTQLNNLSFILQNYFPNNITGSNVQNGIFMSDVVNFKYTLPASGTSATFATIKSSTAQKITINLKRAVARVDVYINKKADVPTIEFNSTVTTTPSKITIKNYKNGLFLQTSTESNAANVGTLEGGGTTIKQSIPNGTTASTATSEWAKICYFYTPSRKAATSEVTANFFGITLNNLRIMNGSTLLTTRTYNLPNLLDKIPNKTFEMNKIYKIYCTINNQNNDLEVTVKYENWGVWEGKYDI